MTEEQEQIIDENFRGVADTIDGIISALQRADVLLEFYKDKVAELEVRVEILEGKETIQ